MLCCGFSTSRLRKFFRFRFLLVAFLVAFSIALLLRSGTVSSPFGRNAGLDQDIIWQDSSGKNNDASASGSGHRSKQMKVQTTEQSLNIITHPITNENKEGTAKDTVLETTIDSRKIVKKSYLELVDEINPSHSLQNDQVYPVDKLKKFTQNMNEKLIVLNKDKFPKRPKHGPVVVVQVHKRLEYLVHLISSLEKAKGIQDVLLIISSDWYSDAIMNAVKQIKFCQVGLAVVF